MIKVTLAILNRNDKLGAMQVIPQINTALFHEIFVIDGNSSDGSQEYFRSQGITVHTQAQGGRGGAMRTAIDKATGDYIIFLSTDGEEDPQDLPKFIEEFKRGADLVIASRMMKGGSFKSAHNKFYFHRRLYLRIITILINILFNAQLTDCWNGYRGFRLKDVRTIKTDAEDFLIEAQQTIRFSKLNKKIVEFPTVEGKRIAGKSGNPILKSGILHIVLIFSEYLKRSSSYQN